MKIKYEDLKKAIVDDFIWLDNDGDKVIWEPFEDYPEENIHEFAESIAHNVKGFLQSKGIKVIY